MCAFGILHGARHSDPSPRIATFVLISRSIPESGPRLRAKLRKIPDPGLSTKQRLSQRLAHLAREAEIENSLRRRRRGFDALGGSRDHLALQLFVDKAR